MILVDRLRFPATGQLAPTPSGKNVSRRWQNVRNARPSFIATDEREYRTLRVLPLDNPATPGYLQRTIDDLSAAGFDAFDGCVNGLDVEVKVLTRHRNLGSLGHHAAVAHLFVVALVEDAINAH